MVGRRAKDVRGRGWGGSGRVLEGELSRVPGRWVSRTHSDIRAVRSGLKWGQSEGQIEKVVSIFRAGLFVFV